jgi:hypothetical protein
VTPAPRRPRQKVHHAHRRPAPGHRPRPARIAAARHGSRAAARPARHPRTRHDRLRRRGPPGRRTARTAGRLPPGDPPGRRPAGSSAPAPATTSRTATSTRRWPQPSVTACSPATASAGGGSDARRPDHPGHLPGRQGGAAAVPAGLRLRPAHPGLRPHRRLPDPAALHRGAQPWATHRRPRPLAGAGAVRPRAVRPDRGVRAAPLRLVSLRRRPTSVHRGPVRAHRSRGGHRGPAHRQRASIRRRARPADHRHHPAPRTPGPVRGHPEATRRYGAGGGPTISRPYLR